MSKPVALTKPHMTPKALPKPKVFAGRAGELRKHLMLLTADGVKKLITKYNADLKIDGISKMNKYQAINALINKKPLDKVLAAKLVNEAKAGGKTRVKTDRTQAPRRPGGGRKPRSGASGFIDDDLGGKSTQLSGGGAKTSSGLTVDFIKGGKTVHSSPLQNTKAGVNLRMTKDWKYAPGKSLRNFKMDGKGVEAIGKGTRIVVKDNGKVVKSRTI
jgi:hypothetical protein